MRLAWQFFKRDATIALSYRASFAVQLLGNLLILGVFYYIGKTIGDTKIGALDAYGGNFLAFLLIGISLGDCVSVSLTTFANQIREGQLTGTLEATLMSPVRLPLILVYSSLWGYFFSAVRFVLYLVLGAVFYGVGFANASVPAAMVIFFLTVLAFMGLGILWASVVVIIKRGESIVTLIGYLVILTSGVLFPVTVLPVWIQQLSSFVPLTPALQGMRLALLQGYTVTSLGPIVVQLGIFAAVLLTLGFGSFMLSLRIAKQTGSLTEF
jgi:ABC-2 type transport system permease protein